MCHKEPAFILTSPLLEGVLVSGGGVFGWDENCCFSAPQDHFLLLACHFAFRNLVLCTNVHCNHVVT